MKKKFIVHLQLATCNYKRLECSPNTYRDAFTPHLSHNRSMIYFNSETVGMVYIWYDGPISQFTPVKDRYNQTATVMAIEDASAGLNTRTVCVTYNGEQISEYTIPSSIVGQGHVSESIYMQMRNRLTKMPPVQFVNISWEGNTIAVNDKFTDYYIQPSFPSGTSKLARLFEIPLDMMDLFGDVCPECHSGFLEGPKCLGSKVVYRMKDGTLENMKIPCLYSPGLNNTPHGTGIEYEDGFKDRARFSTAAKKGRYFAPNHFMEDVNSRHGTQNTIVDPSIIFDVKEHHESRGIHPATRDSVRDALKTLEFYYKGRYELWYRDAQRIAAEINGTPGMPPEISIPYHDRIIMRDYLAAAFQSFMRAPKEIRGTRKNFMRSVLNSWVICSVCAMKEGRAEFLEYRKMFENKDGTPPILKDTVRNNEYKRIWKYLIDDNQWGDIPID